MRLCLRWLLVGMMMVATPSLIGEDTSILLSRMQAAGVQNSLDGQNIKPWHLKVTYQLFDDEQKPHEQGTIEEWWGGPELYKISVASPSYTATRIRNKDQYSSTGDKGPEPYMVGILQNMVMHPLPSDKVLIQSTAKLEQRSLGKMKLDCISLKPEDKKNLLMMSQDRVSTYCFDSSNNSLRLYTLTGDLEVGRNRVGTFQQRTVALDLFVTDDGPTVMTAHIDALSTFEPDPADFAIPAHVANPSTLKPKSAIQIVGPAVIAGRKLGGSQPSYPDSARERHVQGSVVMTAIIGTDGHIHKLDVVVSPDKSLSQAARDAVQDWTYKPYLLNGAPVEVNTTITVNFHIGS